MIPLELLLGPLTKALGLSIVTERVLELLKNVLERVLLAGRTPAVPKLERVEDAMRSFVLQADVDDSARRADGEAAGPDPELEQRRKAVAAELKRATDPATRADLLKRQAALAGEWDERVPPETVLVEPASDPDDGWVLRTLVIQLLGFAAGIVLARLTDTQLFGPLLQGIGRSLADWQDYALTGLFIGGGSGPAHLFIRFITERKQVVREAVEAAEAPGAAPSPAPVPVVSAAPIKPPPAALPTDWVDIPYEGGVDRELLENVHRRGNTKVDMIVYHHTAMKMASPFEDVVRVIKGRGFLTAYHCVVLADGTIRPFCRWDRFGSHAKNYNLRSLGIAFHGNFESNPRVPDANPDGRLGPLEPTEAQLDAGARVVALWTFLYGIKPDFSDVIIPHNKIADKACPGSRFPYDRFRQRVEGYVGAWQGAPAQERITAFGQKPYLGL